MRKPFTCIPVAYCSLFVHCCHAWMNSCTPRWNRQTLAKTSLAAAKKGFGAAVQTKSKNNKKKKKQKLTTYKLPETETNSIEAFLNPRLLEPEVLEDINNRLRGGNVVVIRDAFIDDLANAMHEQLDLMTNWDRNEDYFEDGYHFRHNNIYDKNDFPPLFQAVNKMFESDATKKFMTELTGRDCTGSISGAPSYYESGDHSLPHTDHIGQRSVAYIWHLSKNWRPEWGGALYWAPEPLANAFHHASFNTLVLFSVTPHSSHFVTTVSPKAKEKRLAYNGWWHSSWVPTSQDPLEDMLSTPEQRSTLTHAQILSINDMLDDPWAPRIQPQDRHEKILNIRTQIMEELYPKAKSSPIS